MMFEAPKTTISVWTQQKIT